MNNSITCNNDLKLNRADMFFRKASDREYSAEENIYSEPFKTGTR